MAAIGMIIKWDELEQSMRNVEESNMSNLSERVAVMQRLRKEFCEMMWGVKKEWVTGGYPQSPAKPEEKLYGINFMVE